MDSGIIIDDNNTTSQLKNDLNIIVAANQNFSALDEEIIVGKNYIFNKFLLDVNYCMQRGSSSDEIDAIFNSRKITRNATLLIRREEIEQGLGQNNCVIDGNLVEGTGQKSKNEKNSDSETEAEKNGVGFFGINRSYKIRRYVIGL